MSSPIKAILSYPGKPSSDPSIIKRERMIARLEDQKKLLADPGFVRTVKRWERKERWGEGAVKPLRTSKWWQPDQRRYVMTVKVGSKRIEFEKGKAAIAVGHWRSYRGH
jgi:hypothetical protein